MQEDGPAEDTEQEWPEEKTKTGCPGSPGKKEFTEIRVATGRPDAQGWGDEGISWIWSLGIFATATLRERAEAHLSGG